MNRTIIVIIIIFIIAFIYCISDWNTNSSSTSVTDSVSIMDTSSLKNLNNIVESTMDGLKI